MDICIACVLRNRMPFLLIEVGVEGDGLNARSNGCNSGWREVFYVCAVCSGFCRYYAMPLGVAVKLCTHGLKNKNDRHSSTILATSITI